MTFKKKKIIIQPILKIAVAMWYNSKIAEYADITRKINQKYCDQHNYDLIFSNKINLPDNHPSWECIPLVLDILTNYKYKYDYVIWIDADACFNFQSTNSIEAIINSNRDKSIIFSGDQREFPINCGVFLLKKCQYCIEFCKNIINSRDPKCIAHYKKANWEQECIVKFYIDNINNLKKESIIIPYKIFQIFPQRHNYNIENSLILHWSSSNLNERIKQFTKILNSINITTANNTSNNI